MTASGAHPDYAHRSPLLGQLAGLFRETNAFAEILRNKLPETWHSKLATAGTPAQNVVAYAGDMRVHVARVFTRLLGAEPRMKTLVGMAKGSFIASLGVSSV